MDTQKEGRKTDIIKIKKTLLVAVSITATDTAGPKGLGFKV